MQRQGLRQLPSNKNPTGTRCIQITIPDDDEWEEAAYSELTRLTQWMLWQRDQGKNGTNVGKRWRQALDTWKHCDETPIPPSVGADGGEENLIRQNPDNPCLLETSIDGTHWCTFADLSLCIGGSLNNSIQPGPQPTPDPGVCAEFDVTLAASNKYLLPIGVGGGDTIEISALGGMWNDGGNPSWACPNGHYNILGACGNLHFGTDPGDPCPAIYHMTLIASDGSNCYDSSANFTIAPGVINGSQLIFQANDSDLSNNAGSVSFHIKVCKSSAPVAFYYGLFTNFWAVQQHPDQIVWTPIALGVPTTITSDIPADPSHPDNLRAYLVITFADSFDPTTGNANNSGNVWYKMTAISVSGATFDGGAPYEYTFGTGCSGTGTASGVTGSLPSVPQNLLGFVVHSHTQFVVNVTIEPCS